MFSSACGLISQIPVTSARISGKSVDAVLVDFDEIPRLVWQIQLDDVAG